MVCNRLGMALKASGMTSAKTVTVTPCVEVAAVRTVPGAVSLGCILAEPRKGDKLTLGGNELVALELRAT